MVRAVAAGLETRPIGDCSEHGMIEVLEAEAW
jgi:hypothetical protein